MKLFIALFFNIFTCSENYEDSNKYENLLEDMINCLAITEQDIYNYNKNMIFENKSIIKINDAQVSPICLSPNSSVFLIKLSNGKKLILKKCTIKSNDRSLEEEIFKSIKHHPNIVYLYQSKETTNYLIIKKGRKIKFQFLWLLFEYLEIELAYHIGQIVDYKGVIMNILEGLKKVHDSGFIHGDIKVGNVLGKLSNNGKIVYKLIDFNLSKKMDNYLFLKTNKDSGTIGYIAPEIKKDGIITKASDIWSFGCLVYYLIYGFIDFDNECDVFAESSDLNNKEYLNDDHQERFNIQIESRREILEKNDSKLMSDFFSKCLKPNYKFRATVNELIKDPFLFNISENNYLT